MTPTEIEQACRERYNAVGSTFWSQSEIYTLIYNAEVDFCNRTSCLEKTYQTTTVDGTQEYDMPSTALGVKRATWNGFKLTPINFLDDDIITGYDADTTGTGDPRYFWVWERKIVLRPVPSSAQTLKIWTFNMPETVSSTTNLDIDANFHPWIIDFVTSFMVAKDDNLQLAKYYMDLWESHFTHAKNLISRNKSASGFKYVRDEDDTGLSVIGVI